MPGSVNSQTSHDSKTAAQIIQEQLSLEAEAREALPYQFDTCTQPLGAIRQNLFSCLTCNPPPKDRSAPYTPAGVCYSCSISCHGEHTLVELFGKRNFVCDCGTTRIPETTPCTLRISEKTGQKGQVTGEEPAKNNRYNHNFRNKFCGCGEEYDPQQEKGTMFQCLGLGTVEEGGCGEDWWHPECIMGLTRVEFGESIEKTRAEKKLSAVKAEDTKTTEGAAAASVESNGNCANTDADRPTITAGNGVDGNDVAAEAGEEEDEDTPLPPGFPAEDDFDTFICYKCVEAHPWIKRYAGTEGFLAPVYRGQAPDALSSREESTSTAPATEANTESRKRKADDDIDASAAESSTSLRVSPPVKRQKSEDASAALSAIPEEANNLPAEKGGSSNCKYAALPPAPVGTFSLFLKEDFRDHICHCREHFPLLTPHPQLLEEEDTYEPPVSEDGNDNPGSVGTGSIYDRGEAAFSNMDRMQAIQGAMAYAHLKDGLKAFLAPFAESGTAVGAEDIKAYFEKLRGDEQGIKEAAGGAKAGGNDNGNGGGEGGNRREENGY